MHPGHVLTHFVQASIGIIARIDHASEFLLAVKSLLVAAELSRAAEGLSASGDIAGNARSRRVGRCNGWLECGLCAGCQFGDCRCNTRILSLGNGLLDLVDSKIVDLEIIPWVLEGGIKSLESQVKVRNFVDPCTGFYIRCGDRGRRRHTCLEGELEGVVGNRLRDPHRKVIG